MYTPSLDEAIQEDILGLVRAADRYDPSRGLRFSTYCTYWVTHWGDACSKRFIRNHKVRCDQNVKMLDAR